MIAQANNLTYFLSLFSFYPCLKIRSFYLHIDIHVDTDAVLLKTNFDDVIRKIKNTCKTMASIAKEVTDPNKCISCCQNFKVKKKGFKRTLITKLPIPLIKLNDILDKRITLPLTPTRKFLCHDCASITVKFYKHQISKGPASVSTHKTEKVYSKRKFSFTPTKHVKRKCLSSTPLKSVRSHSLKKEGFKDKVSKYIKDSHYDYAFRLLISKSKRARDALLHVLKSTVKKEVKSANIPSLQTPTTLQHLQEFNWQTVLKDSSCKLPFLSGTLQGALSCRRNRSVNM